MYRIIVHLFFPNGGIDRVLCLSTRFCPRVETFTSREIFCVPAGAEHAREFFAVLAREGFRVLAGAARSSLVARLASLVLRRPGLPRRALEIRPTPAGPLACVPEGEEALFLAPLPVDLLWPAPPRLRAELAAHGLFTIGDVARVPIAVLSQRFGPWGHLLAAYARGEDYRTVRPWSAPLEVSHRWRGEIHDLEGLRAATQALARSLGTTLLSLGQGCRKLNLQLEPVDGPPLTVARRYRTPTAASDVLAARLLALAAPAVKSPLLVLAATAGELLPLKVEQLRLSVVEERTKPFAVSHEAGDVPEAPGGSRCDAARILAWLRNRYPELTTAARLPRSRREEMLRFYDPWRLAAASGGQP